ncbi:hypothetical protein Pyn_33420 [Prunus yedoensis var. nudiflora]|uniref:Uncharacterized protein n=1 Tax=Prunus yedoensis var. nudiflora TaxID=2094558 RepID=A0A314YFX0_PRUYE|nr:hypothetical protein Pyn_33420 [Prunus yedoensis var. nudiflora]
MDATRELVVLHGGSPPVGFILCFKDKNIHLDEQIISRNQGFVSSQILQQTWATYYGTTISIEATKGLAILHGESPPVGFILCFKDMNIHLDENLKVKLLGFGLTDPKYHLTQILFYNQYFAPEYSGK